MTFSTWALPGFTAGTTCDMFDFAVRFSGPPLHLGCSWFFVVPFESQLHSLSTPGSVLIWGFLFPHHQRGLLFPHSTALQSLLMNWQDIVGPAHTILRPRGAQESYTLVSPLITMLGLLIIFDVTISYYPLLFIRLVQWCSIIKSFLEYFAPSFFIYLLTIPSYLSV